MNLEELFPFAGVFLIGASKAGVAGGLGMLTTPMVAMGMTAREAIGVILPLLSIADLFTIILYRGYWKLSLVVFPLVGTLFGILAGIQFIDLLSERMLRLSIGFIVLVLLILLGVRKKWHPHKVFSPPWYLGLMVGILAGFASTLAHSAGPILGLYLLSQKLDKRVFVSTNALFFTLNNLFKIPPYLGTGLITAATLKTGLILLPAIPLGVICGYLINKKLSQKLFEKIVYVLLALAALHLIGTSL